MLLKFDRVHGKLEMFSRPAKRAACLLLMALIVHLGHTVRAEDIDFRKQIQSIFTARCVECHGAEKQEGGLRLDLKDLALAGGDTGVVIVAGEPEESLLFKYVSGEDPDRIMPPDGENLSAEQLSALKMWIAQGANWPDEPE